MESDVLQSYGENTVLPSEVRAKVCHRLFSQVYFRKTFRYFVRSQLNVYFKPDYSYSLWHPEWKLRLYRVSVNSCPILKWKYRKRLDIHQVCFFFFCGLKLNMYDFIWHQNHDCLITAYHDAISMWKVCHEKKCKKEATSKQTQWSRGKRVEQLKLKMLRIKIKIMRDK